MQPARHDLAIIDAVEIDAVLDRLRTRLDSEPGPAVRIERNRNLVTFTAETWKPILVTRVGDALDAELGPAGARQAFRPVP